MSKSSGIRSASKRHNKSEEFLTVLVYRSEFWLQWSRTLRAFRATIGGNLNKKVPTPREPKRTQVSTPSKEGKASQKPSAVVEEEEEEERMKKKLKSEEKTEKIPSSPSRRAAQYLRAFIAGTQHTAR